jgi:predicted kinase
MSLELTILVGLQASGKSTFSEQRFADTHVRVSRDLFPNAKKPAQRQARMVEEALATGRSVVLDNTSPSVADRAVPIGQARAFGARIVGYYFESKISECLERNALRNARARVPDVGMFATLKRLVRPSYAEGFDELFHVRLIDDGFSVSPWQDVRDEQR